MMLRSRVVSAVSAPISFVLVASWLAGCSSGTGTPATVVTPPSVTVSPTEAARILDQTSFGPTAAGIQNVETIGINAYLNQQFAQPTTQLAAIPLSPLPAVCLTANNSASAPSPSGGRRL